VAQSFKQAGHRDLWNGQKRVNVIGGPHAGVLNHRNSADDRVTNAALVQHRDQCLKRLLKRRAAGRQGIVCTGHAIAPAQVAWRPTRGVAAGGPPHPAEPLPARHRAAHTTPETVRSANAPYSIQSGDGCCDQKYHWPSASTLILSVFLGRFQTSLQGTIVPQDSDV